MTQLDEATLAAAREEMVEQIVSHANLVSRHTGLAPVAERVLMVMGSVPRHEFVPAELCAFAYIDRPLPIGFGKTISQPFIVALMTDLLDVQPQDRVLEVGTGLGYQAAVLAELARTVYSVEIIIELAQDAEQRLRKLGYGNVELKVGDGAFGWREHAPFDKIIVTAAPELMPKSLLAQLKPGGRMVIPVGAEDAQQLLLVEKDASGGIATTEVLPVRFTPLVIVH